MLSCARALVARPAFQTTFGRNSVSGIARSRHDVFGRYSFARFSSRGGEVQKDEYGRRVRQRPGREDRRDSFDSDGGGGWDDFEPAPSPPSRSRQGGRVNRSSGGWDDEDNVSGNGGGWDDEDVRPARRPSSGRGGQRGGGQRGGGQRGGGQRGGGQRGGEQRGGWQRGGGNRRSEYDNNRNRDNRNFGRRESSQMNRQGQFNKRQNDEPKVRQINMNALEGAGFIHLYGLSSVLNALESGRRDLTNPEEGSFPELSGGDDFFEEGSDSEDNSLPERKPEAQFRPWLFVQSKSTSSDRSTSKANAAEQVETLAGQKGVPIAHVDKGILNSLSGNRPHQGYVLRCGKMDFETISKIPHPSEDPSSPSLWLVLDEVVDPQNLGALIRSAYFLGGENIGILVCAKNSAPPSPVVSAASAGALEIAEIYSTSNLPRTLVDAAESGFRIIGASSSAPSSSSAPQYGLQDLPAQGQGDDRPVLLVLGSEGHGLRTLVAKSCTEFVTLPAGPSSEDESAVGGVDSLNVSVTGGILLWHMLYGGR